MQIAGYGPQIVFGQCIPLLIRHHLIFALFLFLVNTAQLIGEFWSNRSSGTSNSLQAKQGALAAPIGKVRCICCVTNENLRIC